MGRLVHHNSRVYVPSRHGKPDPLAFYWQCHRSDSGTIYRRDDCGSVFQFRKDSWIFTSIGWGDFVYNPFAGPYPMVIYRRIDLVQHLLYAHYEPGQFTQFSQHQ